MLRGVLIKGDCGPGCCEEYCQQRRLWARMLLGVFSVKGIVGQDAAISILSKGVCDGSLSCSCSQMQPMCRILTQGCVSGA